MIYHHPGKFTIIQLQVGQRNDPHLEPDVWALLIAPEMIQQKCCRSDAESRPFCKINLLGREKSIVLTCGEFDRGLLFDWRCCSKARLHSERYKRYGCRGGRNEWMFGIKHRFDN